MKNDKLPPLSERMLCAAEMISYGSKTADIGCDHGYLSIYLYKSGRCTSCIAADVNSGPLEAAKKNVRDYDAQTGVDIRLSDGLKEIKPGEVDSILIAGMGGGLISRILSEGKAVLEKVKELVLEPQSDSFRVREFLEENGFRIEKEDLVKECGKYYPIIRAVKADESRGLSKEELVYGPCLLRTRNELLKEYIIKEKRILKGVIERLTEKTEASISSRRRIEGELELLSLAEKYYE